MAIIQGVPKGTIHFFRFKYHLESLGIAIFVSESLNRCWSSVAKLLPGKKFISPRLQLNASLRSSIAVTFFQLVAEFTQSVASF